MDKRLAVLPRGMARALGLAVLGFGLAVAAGARGFHAAGAPQADASQEPSGPTAADEARAKQRAAIARELAAAVDLPDPAARAARARQLAKDSSISLEQWEQACREFRPSRALQRMEKRAGSKDFCFAVDVELFVEGAKEVTELALYEPLEYDSAEPHGLVVLLHGAGSDGPSMLEAWERQARDWKLLVLAPSEAGENSGHQASARERESILQALRWMRRAYNVDENRIFIAGVSRGGHLTWDLALRYPDLFAGAIPMAGSPRFVVARGTNNFRYLPNVAHLPIRQLIGELEEPGLRYTVARAFEWLEECEAQDALCWVQKGLGHTVRPGELDFPAFFYRAERDPLPERVRRRFARAGEGRGFWLEVLKPTRSGVEEEWVVRAPRGSEGPLTLEEQFALVREQAEERTADVQARWVGPGRFEVDSSKVQSMRLLLSRDMLGGAESVQITANGRKLRRKAAPSEAVLLSEFVERFDRTFLPVVEQKF